MAPVVEKSVKVSKSKKPSVSKKIHTPYAEMIKGAIVALKERTGSSQYAIAKHMEENHKDLAQNFKKLLLVQLRKLVAAGKLTKVKNSFKLGAPAAEKKAPAADATKAPATKKKAVVAKKPKSAATPVKAKKVAAAKPKKAAKTATVTSPGKKKAAKPVGAKVKKTPVKALKKPKSIKSPAKKAPAKKAKK